MSNGLDLSGLVNELQASTCSVHQQHPEVKLHEGDIQIKACCQPFHDELNAKVEAGMKAQIEKMLEDMFKGLDA